MTKYGSYTVVKKLGEGAFGKVYEVTKNSETYALKKIAMKNCSIDERKELSKEIEVLKRLRDNNVVYYIESFTEGIDLFIVMEYCNGGDLNSLVLKKPNIAKSTLMDYILQIGTGLAYLHNSSIIHRDIKPDNIMIANSRCTVTVKVADFGLARIWETSDESPYYDVKYGIKGPKYYTAPEVYKEKVTVKSDVFSMGCVILALFSRTTVQWIVQKIVQKILLAPYVGSMKQICDATESEKKSFIKKYVDTAALRELVEKMVHSEWRSRPSAEEVVTRLRNI